MTTNQFSFEGQKVASMPLDDFMLSGRIIDPSSADDAGAWDQPHQFFVMIQEKLKELQCPYHFDDVYVSSRGAEYLADPLDRTSARTELRRWAFTTLVTRILLYEKTEIAPAPDYAPAIGIGFTEAGLQVSIGTDVWVCRNMSIFGSLIISSFGPDKLGMNDFMSKIEQWIKDAEQINKHNTIILNKLTSMAVNSRGGIQRLIGQLYINREYKNLGAPVEAPLDKDEIADLTKRILETYPEYMEDDQRSITLYDLYNICTNILTHSTKNLHNKWLDIAEMGDFIVNNYLVIVYDFGQTDDIDLPTESSNNEESLPETMSENE